VRGQLESRGKNVWRLRVDVGRDPATGRRRTVSKTFRGPKRAAHDELAALVVAHTRRRPDTQVTFAAVYRAWLDHITPDRSPLTIQRYEQAARLHALPAIGDTPLDQIGAADLDAIYSRMRRQGHTPASVRKVHQVIAATLGQAVKWKYLNANPATDATPPADKRTEPPDVDPAMVRAAFAHVAERDPSFALYVHLAAVTGCRRAELCALRWTDIDLEHATISIARALVSVRGGHTIEKATKTDKPRRLAIPATTVANLAAHRVRLAETMLAVGVRTGSDGYLFPSSIDGVNPTRPDVMTARWMRLRDAVGAEGLRLHDLRHHSASTLISEGVDIRTVMERHGWTSLATAQRYIHVVEAKDRAAADILERVMGESG